MRFLSIFPLCHLVGADLIAETIADIRLLEADLFDETSNCSESLLLSPFVYASLKYTSSFKINWKMLKSNQINLLF